MSSSFRDHLFPLDHPRLAGLRELDPSAYGDMMKQHPLAGPIIGEWVDSFMTTPFTGVTSDGAVIPDLFPVAPGEAAPTVAAVAAAAAFLEGLTPDLAEQAAHPVDSRVWRAWMNPEFYINRFGVRLEDLDQVQRDLALGLIEASLSEVGYALVRDVMRINAFLGDVVDLPRLLNEFSYNLNIFGTPALDQPWGWNLYGHHLCLNTLFVGDQQFFTPVFFGAEPNEIDAGAETGTTVLRAREERGLAFVRGLSAAQAQTATLYELKRDPQMPAGRVHPADELHLAGAFQDNRVIPYEGLRLSELGDTAREAVVEIAAAFLDYQPDGPREARLREFRAHLDDTWFCWIGGTNDDDAFYYRVQSPVLLLEFDHHAGIFLSNEEPEQFHIHTLVRTPNGNDYGAAVAAQAIGTAHSLEGTV